MKNFFSAFLLMACIGTSLHAENISTPESIDYDLIADINPDDIPLDTVTPSNHAKLQLLWEYLKLQTILAKTHVLEHKKTYLAIAALLAISGVIAYRTIKK